LSGLGNQGQQPGTQSLEDRNSTKRSCLAPPEAFHSQQHARSRKTHDAPWYEALIGSPKRVDPVCVAKTPEQEYPRHSRTDQEIPTG